MREFGIRTTAVYVGGMNTELFRAYGPPSGQLMDSAHVADLVVALASTPADMIPTEITIERRKSSL